MVFKEHKFREAAEREVEFLKILGNNNVAVPKVIKIEGNILCLEYITGKPLPDFMMEHDAIYRCGKVAEILAIWLESYYVAVNHDTTSIIRGDVNGRNFLVVNDRIVGVDFEELIFGRKESDFGRLLAYIATYNYDDTKVQRTMEEKLTESFIKRFSLSEEVLQKEKAVELKVLEGFRKRKI
jgi:RIO-like serine/threonine protein kinase